MSDNNCPPAYDNVINGQKPTYPNQQQAYPTHSYPPQSYPPQGYPPQGYPPQGYPPQGYAPQGFPAQGYPQQTTTSVVVRAGTTGNPAIVYNNMAYVNRRRRITGTIVTVIVIIFIINIILWSAGTYSYGY
jgi:hypothetical protein